MAPEYVLLEKVLVGYVNKLRQNRVDKVLAMLLCMASDLFDDCGRSTQKIF